MKLTTIISAFYLFCLLCIQPVHADGGFWLPTQIQGKVHQAMKKQGLRLSEKDIYDINQSCLSNAILSLSYDNSTFSPSASASFISGEGLVLTNFHCVARYLEHISDANHDYVKHGCWATQRSEETYLPNLGQSINHYQRRNDRNHTRYRKSYRSGTYPKDQRERE